MGKSPFFPFVESRVEFVMKPQLGPHVLAVCRLTLFAIGCIWRWVLHLWPQLQACVHHDLDKAFSWSMFWQIFTVLLSLRIWGELFAPSYCFFYEGFNFFLTENNSYCIIGDITINFSTPLKSVESTIYSNTHILFVLKPCHIPNRLPIHWIIP